MTAKTAVQDNYNIRTPHLLVELELEFYDPVNIVKVKLSRSVNMTTLFF